MAAYRDRGTAVFFAKLAVESQRYDDVACKNAILSRCSSWRILKAILQREGSEENGNLITEYIGKVKEEIATVSTRTKSLLESHVLPTCSNENKVFCYKIIGDHFKYRAEFNLDERRELGDYSSKAYETATEIADLSDMPYINLIRLTLALNFSILCHDILGNMSDRACEIAETARNGAMSQIHTLNEEGREEIAWVLDKLQNNIAIWAEANVANGVDGHNSSTSGDVDSQNPSSGDVDDLNSSDGRNSYDADVDGNNSVDGNDSSTTSTGSEDQILFHMPVVPR